MRTLNLAINTVYTDGYIRYRKIVEFAGDAGPGRMVRYEKGMILPNGNWRKFYTGEDHVCKKSTFAKWALKRVEVKEGE